MNQQTAISQKLWKPSRRKTKHISKRIKTEDKFHYDLDKLKFTIGRIITPNKFKTHKAMDHENRKAKQKEAEEEKQREAEEEKQKDTEKEAKRKKKGFKKASPEKLAYRDLFVRTKSLENGVICSICLRNFNRFVWKLSCNHYFHYNCIEKWSAMRNYTCPLCRQEYRYP